MSIDSRLLDCDTQQETAENFNRVMNAVDNSDGNIEDLQEEITAIKTNAYAELYVNENATASSIPTGETYTVLSLGSAAVESSISGFVYNGEDGTLTAESAGKYFVCATFCSKLATTDVIWDTAVFVNGVIAPNAHIRRRFSTSGYTFSVTMNGTIELSADDVIDIRVKHNNASAVSITTEFANISLFRVSTEV